MKHRRSIRPFWENLILNRIDKSRQQAVRQVLDEVDEEDPITAILKSRGRQGGRTLFDRLIKAGGLRPRELREIVREVQHELRAEELRAKSRAEIVEESERNPKDKLDAEAGVEDLW